MSLNGNSKLYKKQFNKAHLQFKHKNSLSKESLSDMILASCRQRPYTFKFKIVDIEIANGYKYLGTIFYRNGSFLNAKRSIAQKAINAMYALIKKPYQKQAN